MKKVLKKALASLTSIAVSLSCVALLPFTALNDNSADNYEMVADAANIPELEMGTVEISSDDLYFAEYRVIIPIYINDAAWSNATCVIEYDPQVLTYEQAYRTSLTSDAMWADSNNADDGLCCVVFVASTEMNPGHIADIAFTVNADMAYGDIPLVWNTERSNVDELGTYFVDGAISIDYNLEETTTTGLDDYTTTDGTYTTTTTTGLDDYTTTDGTYTTTTTTGLDDYTTTDGTYTTTTTTGLDDYTTTDGTYTTTTTTDGNMCVTTYDTNVTTIPPQSYCDGCGKALADGEGVRTPLGMFLCSDCIGAGMGGTTPPTGTDVTTEVVSIVTTQNSQTTTTATVTEREILANAFMFGMIGNDTCWAIDEVNDNSTAAYVTGDGQYTVEWVLEGGGTDTLQFLAVCIAPTETSQSFTSTFYPDLFVTVNQVWIDGVLYEDYQTSDNAITYNYYESSQGVTRIYLHDQWSGTGVADIPANTSIYQSVKVVFTIGGLGGDQSETVVNIAAESNTGEEIPLLYADDKTPISLENYTITAIMGDGSKRDITQDCFVLDDVAPYSLYWDAYNTGSPALDFKAYFGYIGNDGAVLEYLENKATDKLCGVDFKIAQRGDANLDHFIDTKDAALMANYCSLEASGAEPPTLSATNNLLAFFAGDNNTDGVIDTKDAAKVARYASLYAAYSPADDTAQLYYEIWSEIFA